MDRQIAMRTANWYASLPGRRAAALLRRGIRPMLHTSKAVRLLIVGAGPLIDGFDAESVERLVIVAASPAPGVVVAESARLPFAEAVFDTALVAHTLETADSPRKTLRELWRVLAPAGEIVVVVANRAGAWSLGDATPFGDGRPFGRSGLTRTIAEAMFEVVDWRMALAAPPLRGFGWSEGLLARAAPGMAGVHLVRARKVDGLAPAGGGGVRVHGVAVQGG